ncbi:MAG: leucine-rich repeat domain-containing protein [Parabacteroides sp.]|nr:leucine-rich repeat domain-containing protein [Parabacteroides sp.]
MNLFIEQSGWGTGGRKKCGDMKIRYLMASLLACLVGFSSCGSDGDEPTPDKPGGGNEGVKSKTMIVNVESPGTFGQLFEKQLPDFYMKEEDANSILLDTLILKGKLNMEDIEYLNSIEYTAESSIGLYWYVKDVESIDMHTAHPILDLSEAQFVESTFKGETYLANHLYPRAGYLCYRFYVKYPKNIEVIEAEAFWGGSCLIYDISNLLNEGLQEIRENAFESVRFAEKGESWVELDFPSSLKKIEKEAFSNVQAILKKVKTSGNVILSENAFSGTSIESLELKGVEEINSIMINGSLKEVSMPNAKYVRDYAFRGLSDLEIKAEGLKNVVEIGKCAFKGIKTMPDLSLATNLTKIGEEAFSSIKKYL